MPVTTLLQILRQVFSNPRLKQKQGKKLQFSPILLEERWLPDASIALVGNVLTLDGFAAGAELKVSSNGDDFQFELSGDVWAAGDANANLLLSAGNTVLDTVTVGAITSISIGSTSAVGTVLNAGSIQIEDLSIVASESVTLTDAGNDFDSVTIHTTGVGNVELTDVDDITLSDVDTFNGSITVVAGGNITATDVQSLTNADANDISLTANGAASDIVATTISAGTNGDVTLIAGDDVVDSNSTDANLITADFLTVTAANATDDVTDGIRLDTTVTSLDASVNGATAGGGIEIDETNSITLADLDTANGSISVTAAGSITATDVKSLLDLDVNDISLTANGAGSDIFATDINAGSAGDVTLVAGDAISDTNSADANVLTADFLSLTSVNGTSLDTTISSLAASNTTSGNILIQETNGLIIGGSGLSTLAGNGDINVDVITGNLNVNAAVAANGSGTVGLAATNGALTTTAVVYSVSGAISISADSVNQNAGGNIETNGLVTVVANSGDITMSDGTGTLGRNGGVSYIATGNIALSVIVTSSGNIVVTADSDVSGTGSITDNTLAETENLGASVGTTVTLTSAEGIGSVGAGDINTSISTLAATNTTSGNIYIKETSVLIIGGTGVRTLGGNGNINLDALDALFQGGSDLTVNSAISAHGSGTVTLRADVGAVILNAAVSSTTGSIAITGDIVNQNVGGNISTGGAGSVNVTADNGVVSMADGTTTSSVNGDINYSSTFFISLSQLNSTSGDITVTADSDNNNDGNIYDALADTDSGTAGEQGINLSTSGTATLAAAQGIGSFDGINTAIGTLVATNSISGNILIQETNGLIIGGTGVRTLAGNGIIDLDVDAGDLTINSVATSHGSGLISLNADAGTIAVSAAVSSTTGSIQFMGDTISQNVGGNISTGGTGTVGVTADNGAITMADGTNTTTVNGLISYSATNNVALSRLISTDATIAVRSDSDSNNTGAIIDVLSDTDVGTAGEQGVNLSTAGRAQLLAGQGIGAAGDGDIDTTIGTLAATNDLSGDIFIQETNELIIDNDVRNYAGNIDVIVTTGNLTVVSSVGASGSGTVTLNVDAGTMIIAALVSSMTGDVNVSGDTISQLAGGNIGTTDGTITVSADNGSITMADGTTATSGNGAISYSATTDVAISQLISNADVTVTADSDNNNTGSITDALVDTDTGTAGEQGDNIIKNGPGLVTLKAAQGIGTAGNGDIDTTIETLVATNSTSGDIVVQETNGLVIGGSGVRTLAGNGNVNIDADAGSLTVNSVVTAHGSGAVTLNADGGITNTALISSTSGEILLDGRFVIQQADISTGGAGAVHVFGFNGDIIMVDGTTTSSDSGEISYGATGSIALSRLISTNAAISVTADSDANNTGAITDSLADTDGGTAGEQGINLSTSGTVTLMAPQGIGAVGDGDIDVSGGSLGISADASNVFLSEENTISWQNSVFGTATLSSGTFSVGSLQSLSGNIVVAAGTLGGTGTVLGSVTAQNGATVAPGLSPGILNTGNFNLVAGADLDIEINGITVGTQYDQVNVTGTATLAGNLNLAGTYVPAGGETFTIINNDLVDTVSGVFASVTGGTDANGGTLQEGDLISNFLGTAMTARISYLGGSGNDVVLTVLPSLPSTYSFSAASFLIGETNANFTNSNAVVLNRTGSLSAETVSIQIAAGTATAGSDFVAETVDVVFAAGQTTAFVSVQILGDQIIETNETISLTIVGFSGTGIAGGTNPTSEVSITNDDLGSITVNDVSVNEANNLVFTLTLDLDTAQNITVRVDTADVTAFSPADFAAISNQTVTFLAGGGSGQTQTVTVIVNDDATSESTETMQLNLTNARFNGAVDASRVGIGDAQGIGTILDNDTAEVSINDVSQLENGNLQFTVTLSHNVSEDVTVVLNTADIVGEALAGTDYTAVVNQTVTFTANSGANATQIVTVLLNHDGIVEDDEQFSAVLSDVRVGGLTDLARAAISDGTGVGTILNDDSAVLTIAGVTANETDSGSFQFQFNVTLSAAVEDGLSVTFSTSNDTATAGSDYTAIINGVLNFAGTLNEIQKINVTVFGDTTFEATEVFTVALGAITATNTGINVGTFLSTAGSPASGTIANDDTPLLVVLQGGSLTITDETVSGQNDSISISFDGGTNEIVITSAGDNLGTGSAIVSNTLRFAAASVTDTIFVTTRGGNDVLLVDYRTGDPVTGTGGIVYNGGPGGNDGLSILGNSVINATYRPDVAVSGNGFIDLGNTLTGNIVNGSFDRVTFSGLEPVDISGMATATLVLPGLDDLLTVADGTDFFSGGVNNALRVSGTSNAVAIETAAFWNNAHLVIDTVTGGGDGNDLVIISGGANGHNNASISVLAGAGAEEIRITSDAITTTANQTYEGATTLSSASNTVTLNGVNIAFQSSLRSVVDGEESLDVHATGAVTLSDAVGDNAQRLNSMTSSSASLAINSTLTVVNHIAIKANILSIGGAVAGGGTLSIAQLTNGTTIGIGAAAVGVLNLDTAELALLTDGFTAIVIGDANTDDVDVNASSFSDNLTINGANISVTGLNAAANNVTLNAVQSITDGDDVPVDIIAGALVLSAGTGIGTAANQIETTAATLQATNSTSGGIFLRETSGLQIIGSGVQTQAGNGDIRIDVVAGDLEVNAAVTADGAGTVTLTAGENIELGALVSSTSGNLTLTADSDLSNTGAIIDSTVAESALLSTTGTAFLSAATGIGSGNAIETTVNILDAHNTLSGNIEISETDSINVQRILQDEDDSISLIAAGNIEILAAGTGVIIDDSANADGNADILLRSTAGNVLINQIVRNDSDHADADIVLDAIGQNSDVTVNALVSTAAGDITFEADDSVLFTATGDLTAAGAGNVLVNANRANTVGNNADGIVMADGTVINAGSGTITLTALGTNSGDITLGSLQTTNATANAVLVRTNSGAILDGGDANVDIIANAVGALTTLDAQDGIGSGNAIETTVDILDAHNTLSGNIEISETDSINVQRILQDEDDSISLIAAGNIEILAAGTGVIIDDSANADGNADILLRSTAGNVLINQVVRNDSDHADADIVLDAIGQNSDVTVNALVSTAAGDITFEADDSLLFTATGDVTAAGAGNVLVNANRANTVGDNADGIVMADGTVINAGSGTITLTTLGTNSGDITLGSLQTTNATANAVLVRTNSGAILDGSDANVDIIANAVGALTTLDAQDGIGSGNAIETTVDILDAHNTLSGNIEISETDSINVQRILQDEDDSISLIAAGNIEILAAGTGVIIDDSANADGNADILLRSTAGNVLINQIVRNDSDHADADIVLDAIGQNSDVTVNALVSTAAGDITFEADDSVLFTATGDVTAAGAGNVLVNANRANTVGDNADGIVMADGTVINAGSGTITLTALGTNSGDITLGSLQTTNATANAVLVRTNSGAILDGGDANVDIIANAVGALTTLDAQDGIGSGNAIETTVNILDAHNTLSGNIEISETDSINVQRILQDEDDSISLIAAGNIEILAAGTGVIIDDSANADGNADILLRSTAANVLINQVVRNDSDHADADIVLDAIGQNSDVTVNALVSTAAGDITIEADDSVLFTATGDLTAAGAGNVLVNANRANTVGNNADGIVMADGTVINAGSGTITLTTLGTNSGDITLGSLQTTNATANAVLVRTNSGAILDGGDANVDIIANAVGALTTLDAQDGIGSGNAIETTVNILDAHNTLSGNIEISETDSINVQRILQDEDDSISLIAAGNIEILAAGTGVIIDDSANADGNADILLRSTAANVLINQVVRNDSDHADADIVLDAIGQNSDVTVNALVSTAAGDITIEADDSVLFTATGDLTAAGAGNVLVNANRANTVGNNADGIVMADGTVINAGSGTITLTTLGTNSGDITLGSLQTTNATANAVLVRTSSGAILDGGDANVDIIANAVGALTTLDAQDGIGSGNAIETTVNILDAHNTLSGNIEISETDSINVQRILQDGDDSISLIAAGNIEILAAGTGVIIDDSANADGNADILLRSTAGNVLINQIVRNDSDHADADIVLDAIGQNSDVTVNALVSTAAGDITFEADDSVLFTATGDVTAAGAGNVLVNANRANTVGDNADGIVMADGTVINAGSGTITLTTLGTNSGDITLGSLQTTNATANAVLVRTSSGAILDGGDANVDIIANAVGALTTLDAQDGIGSGNAIETTVNILDAHNTLSGNIEISETDSINVQRILQDGDDSISLIAAGNIEILAAGTGVIIDDSANADGNADILLRSTAGNVLINQIVRNDSDHADADIVLDAIGQNSDVTVNALVSTAAGDITFEADDSVLFTATGDVTAAGAGNVLVNANRANTVGDNADGIVMADGTVINAGSGTITLTTLGTNSGDITLGSLQTTNATANAVLVRTSSGAILDGGDANVDIIANAVGALTTLDAQDGIGSGNAIETTVNILDAHNTLSGNIEISETDSINVQRILQDGDDSISLIAAGNIEILAAGTGVIIDDSANADGNADILLRSTAGNVLINQIVRNDSDHADADIVLDAIGQNSDVTVNALVSTAAGDITFEADDSVLFTATGDVTAAGAGNVLVNANRANTVGDNADGIVMADGTVINAGSGTITLTTLGTNSGDITLGSLQTTNATANAVLVRTSSGAILDGGDANVDIIANAVGALTTLDAQDGIGSGNAIETSITSLRASNTTTNTIQVTELAAGGNLALQAVTNGTRDVTIIAGNGSIIDGNDSLLTANADLGQDQIVVTDGQAFSIGDTVVLSDGDSPSETFTVIAIAGNTLTLSGNLTSNFSVAQNARVAGLNITAGNATLTVTNGSIGATSGDVFKGSFNPIEVTLTGNLTATAAGGAVAVSGTVGGMSNISASTGFIQTAGNLDISGLTFTVDNLALLVGGTLTIEDAGFDINGDLRIEAANVETVTANGTVRLGSNFNATSRINRLLYEVATANDERVAIFADQIDVLTASSIQLELYGNTQLIDLDCDLSSLNTGIGNTAIIFSIAGQVTQGNNLGITPGTTVNDRILSTNLLLVSEASSTLATPGTPNFILDNSGNDIDILAARTVNGIVYRDVDDLTVGSASSLFLIDLIFPSTATTPVVQNIAVAPNFAAAAYDGIVTSDGDVLLSAGGLLTLNQQINVGTADVRLIANGDVSQAAAGIITADELGIRQQAAVVVVANDVDANTRYDILLGDNNDVNTLAASNAFAGGAITFNDVDDLTVDAVTALTNVSLLSADAVEAQNQIVVNNGQAFSIGDTIVVSDGDSSSETFTINAIVGNTLTLSGNLASNFTLAQNARVDGIVFTFFTLTNGVSTTNGDILLNANGFLTLTQQVNSGTADVRLIAGGDITQSATGIITADQLGVRQEAAVVVAPNDSDANNRYDILLGDNNDVNKLAARNDFDAGVITFNDRDDLTIATVVDQGSDGVTFDVTNGLATNNADVKLTTGGNLTIGVTGDAGVNDISVGTGDLTLNATGAVTQLAGNVITANGLQLLGTGAINLDDANNDVAILAASHSGTISYRDLNTLVIGSVTDSAMTPNTTTSGITNNADVKLTTGGNLTIGVTGDAGVNDVTVTGGNDLTLNATGAVTQLAGNVITASGLQLLGTGAINLDDANNDVAILAASHSGTISYRDLNTLVIGSVTDSAMTPNTTTSGITNNADVKLTTGGNLTIGVTGDAGVNDVTVTGGNDLTLNATGAVTQLAGNVITANGLQLLGTGAINLDDANNDVAILAASHSGTISYRDLNTLVIGSVTDSAMTPNTTTSGITNNADVKLTTGGNLTIGVTGDAGVTTSGDGSTIDLQSASDIYIIADIIAGSQKQNEADNENSSNGEEIFITSGSGNIAIGFEKDADGNITGDKFYSVLISTDQDLASGKSFDLTSDRISIVAGSSTDGTGGKVEFGNDVTIRTDGGVAKQWTPLPTQGVRSGTAFFQFGTNNDNSQLAILGNISNVGNSIQGVFQLIVGVAGEENLRLDIDWRDIENNSAEVVPDPKSEADNVYNGNYANVTSDRYQLIRLNHNPIDKVGDQLVTKSYQIAHRWGVLEISEMKQFTADFQDGRITVDFAVSHHESIDVRGTIQDSTTLKAKTLQVSSTDDITTGPNPLTANPDDLAKIVGKDTKDLQFENGVVEFTMPVSAPQGFLTKAEGIAPIPAQVLVRDQPVIITNPVVAQELDYATTAQVSGTEVYFRMTQTLPDGTEVPIGSDIKSEAFSSPDALDALIRSNNLPDGTGYEVKLILETGGKTIERSVLEFDITGGQPQVTGSGDADLEELKLERRPDFTLEPDAQQEEVPAGNDSASAEGSANPVAGLSDVVAGELIKGTVDPQAASSETVPVIVPVLEVPAQGNESVEDGITMTESAVSGSVAFGMITSLQLAKSRRRQRESEFGMSKAARLSRRLSGLMSEAQDEAQTEL